MAYIPPVLGPATTNLNNVVITAPESDPNSLSFGNIFKAPSFTTAQIQAIPVSNKLVGNIIYNSDTEVYMVYVNTAGIDGMGNWNNINTSFTYLGGVGLDYGSPFAFPAGPRAEVEVAANADPGFIYVDNTDDTHFYPRIFTGANGWQDIPISGAPESELILPNIANNVAEVPANEIAGYMYYDTSTNQVRSYIDSAWSTIYSMPIASTVGAALNGTAFVLPQGDWDLVEIPQNQNSGFMYSNDLRIEDASFGGIRTYTTGDGWCSVYTMAIPLTSGIGLDWQSTAFALPPSITDSSVETTQNQISGFLYYASTSNQLRGYIDSAWSTIYSMPIASTVGAALNGTAFVLPQGSYTTVEVTSNQVNGFIYHNNANTELRGFVGAEWSTIYSMPIASTVGAALNGTAFVLPNGSSSSVEVSANQVNGFMYYNITANNLRVYANGGWHTVTIV